MLITERQNREVKPRVRPATAAEPARPDGPPADARGLVSLLRLVTTPTRMRILFELEEQPLNVGEICNLLGNPSQPAVSHQLAMLRQGRLVEARRQGRHIVYQLSPIGRTLTGSLHTLLKKERA